MKAVKPLWMIVKTNGYPLKSMLSMSPLVFTQKREAALYLDAHYTQGFVKSCTFVRVEIREYDYCLWSATDDGFYETSCGHAFEFTTDGVKANEFKHCPYCGNAIREVQKRKGKKP